MQMDLPLSCRCKTVDGSSVKVKPLFNIAVEQANHDYIRKLTNLQNRTLKGLPQFLPKHDHYKMTSDSDLLRLVQKLLTPNASKRLTAAEILNHKFIRKWNLPEP